tara:strand:- start:1651 stop:1899 length:249 start_codon:yes stop_codon:yes gene_type:complete
MDRIEIVSNILNDSKVYDKISEALGIKADNDSEIFREIEEYIVEQYDEMDNNRDIETCKACNEEVKEDSYYCSKECYKIDTE